MLVSYFKMGFLYLKNIGGSGFVKKQGAKNKRKNKKCNKNVTKV